MPDWVVVPQDRVLVQSWLKLLDKQLRVKASSHHRPGVKSKAITKFIKRKEKHPDRWDLVKELSQKMADV
jgi:Fe-S cluster assembly scaffold protein SufB